MTICADPTCGYYAKAHCHGCGRDLCWQHLATKRDHPIYGYHAFESRVLLEFPKLWPRFGVLPAAREEIARCFFDGPDPECWDCLNKRLPRSVLQKLERSV